MSDTAGLLKVHHSSLPSVLFLKENMLQESSLPSVLFLEENMLYVQESAYYVIDQLTDTDSNKNSSSSGFLCVFFFSSSISLFLYCQVFPSMCDMLYILKALP